MPLETVVSGIQNISPVPKRLKSVENISGKFAPVPKSPCRTTFSSVTGARAEQKQLAFTGRIHFLNGAEPENTVSLYFDGKPAEIMERAFSNVNVTATVPAGMWTADDMQQYGGNVKWVEK